MVLFTPRKFIGLLFVVILSCTAHASILTDSSKWNKKQIVAIDTIQQKLNKDFSLGDSIQTSATGITAFIDQFYDDGLITASSADNDTIRAIIDKATAIFAKIESAQNFITNLNNTTGFELPVGISKTVGGLNYTIGIDAIRLKPSFAEIDAYMQFEIPQNGKKLTFMARGIKLSKSGGIIGDATLALIGDYAVNFNGDKGQLILKGNRGRNGGSFVRMDCDGFREMGLDAEVRFSRDLLLPEDVNGAVKDGNVAAGFQTVINNWNDLLVQISLPNFQVAGLNGFGFSISDAVFDFSDTRNAPSVVFPKDYATESDPSLANLWRGIYVRQLSVRLPSHFRNKQNSATSLTATDLLIDHQGVSGMFEGKNLIPLNNGDMNGWAFSVDSLAVSLIANQIQTAGFKGSIVVPVANEQNAFKYAASFGANNQYLFDIMSTKDMQFNIFQAGKVEIYKGSTLEVKLDNGRFLPKAILNGKMNINAKLSDGGQSVSLADITFENLRIQSVQPYIQVGNFSFGSEATKQAMAGFPIHIENVSMKNITVDQVGLSFDLKLNLVGESAGAFAADAGLTIVGQLGSTNGSQSWGFKEIEIRNIDIDIDQGEAFKFKGSLAFYREDPVYGDGFNGSVDAQFFKINVKASAIFGNLKGERYWYADALAKFSPGIPFAPGVGFYGFGGGAYYRMKMDRSNSSPLGKTASGVSYVPALENGLGLKAIVYIGSIPNEKAFTGDVTFEVAFFKGGGIHTISMTGNAFIATPEGIAAPLDQLKATVGKMQANLPQLNLAIEARGKGISAKITDAETANVNAIQGAIGAGAGDKGGISAHVFISYDFENSTLHGNFDTKIDIASVIKGGGDAVLHFSPHEWYVYIGTPDNRFTIGIGIGSIRANADSYFMVGSTIPGSPPPPQEVSQILGGKDLDYMKDLNAIGKGAGFAFGSSMSFKTGDLTFLVFYASFSAGAGFDIMVKDYGNTYCEGSDSRIGINGWYANGQAYAYFTGKVGIKVDLFWDTYKIDILDIGAAAVLQAKLPNPIWFRGTVGGYFSVLGGAVSGKCDFQVTLGSECKIVQKSADSQLSNLSVISQLTPGVGETEVNVFNSPQAVFNLAVDKQFDLADDRTHQAYRIKLDYFNLSVDGNSIQGTVTWNDSHTVAAISTLDVLPPQKEIKSSAQISFEKLVSGAWTKVLQNGQPIVEKREATFTTGTAPDYIPLSNVEYSYPVIGQLNFYKDEASTGYIKLKKGQPYLFNLDAEWRQVGRFTDLSSNSNVPFDFAYNSGAAIINYTLPASSLKNVTIYNIQLVNVPSKQNGSIDRNVSSVSSQASVGGQTLNTEIKTQQAQGNITQLQEKTIFSGALRTSKYNTLASKVAAQNLATVLRGIRVLWRVHYLKGSYEIDEPFDKAELYGTNFTGNKPLVSCEADLTDNSYYNTLAYPLIYEGYPLDGNIVIRNRTPETLGTPPVKAVTIIQTPDKLELDQNDPQYNPLPTSQYFFYDLPNYMNYDFQDIQSQVANRYLSSSIRSSRIEQILWSQFPIMLKGDYKVNVRYTIPGQQNINSAKQVILYNPIGY